MAQTQIVVTITDLGYTPSGDLMAKLTITYRGFGMQLKRQKVSGFVNLTEWIKNNG